MSTFGDSLIPRLFRILSVGLMLTGIVSPHPVNAGEDTKELSSDGVEFVEVLDMTPKQMADLAGSLMIDVQHQETEYWASRTGVEGEFRSLDAVTMFLLSSAIVEGKEADTNAYYYMGVFFLDRDCELAKDYLRVHVELVPEHGAVLAKIEEMDKFGCDPYVEDLRLVLPPWAYCPSNQECGDRLP
jgi:hypothetical protein